jgi:hypothetical protein
MRISMTAVLAIAAALFAKRQNAREAAADTPSTPRACTETGKPPFYSLKGNS